MKPFKYQGPIPPSKSLMNRALLIQSYFPEVQIEGDRNVSDPLSDCDDIRHMRSAIQNLRDKKDVDCGEAGTVLRFMALRASREPGFWRLKGTPRLFQRPQEDLVFLLNQLGVSAELTTDALLIQSEGWKKPLIPIQIHRQRSSQFASSLLLNSWNLPFSYEFEMRGHGLSEGYWQMSLTMAQEMGLQVRHSHDSKCERYSLSSGQVIAKKRIHVEMDYSSAFAVAAAAVLGGEIEITNCDSQSLQPDFMFIEILKKMRVKIHHSGQNLTVSQTEGFSPIDYNVENCPDLFPVLAVLCAFAQGTSKLFGAPQLVHKESNRIKKTAELLSMAGVEVKEVDHGLEIHGVGPNWKPTSFVFNPDQDHRMAMAGALLRFKSCPIKIVKPEVVNKSFPQFWKILGFSL